MTFHVLLSHRKKACDTAWRIRQSQVVKHLKVLTHIQQQYCRSCSPDDRAAITDCGSPIRSRCLVWTIATKQYSNQKHMLSTERFANEKSIDLILQRERESKWYLYLTMQDAGSTYHDPIVKQSRLPKPCIPERWAIPPRTTQLYNQFCNQMDPRTFTSHVSIVPRVRLE